jgi:hypothetical protein
VLCFGVPSVSGGREEKQQRSRQADRQEEIERETRGRARPSMRRGAGKRTRCRGAEWGPPVALNATRKGRNIGDGPKRTVTSNLLFLFSQGNQESSWGLILVRRPGGLAGGQTAETGV